MKSIEDYDRLIESFNKRLKSNYPLTYKHSQIENHFSMVILTINNINYWIQWTNGDSIYYFDTFNKTDLTRNEFFTIIKEYEKKIKLYEDLNNTIKRKEGGNVCIKI